MCMPQNANYSTNIHTYCLVYEAVAFYVCWWWQICFSLCLARCGLTTVSAGQTHCNIGP